MKKAILAFGLVVLLVVVLIYTANPGKGMVILDDWEHGFAMCDGTPDTPKELLHVSGDDYAYHWTKDGIYYVVNKQAIADTEKINKLRTVAKTQCDQYLN